MIPVELSQKIDEISNKLSHKDLINTAKNISEKYRFNDGTGKTLVSKSEESIAYAISRMPATFEAVNFSINQVVKRINKFPETLLDVGAGTGAATWAANEFFELSEISCFEKEDSMIDIGKNIMDNSDKFNSVEWKKFDVCNDLIEKKYDFVVASYVLNELKKEDRFKVVDKLWNATNDILLIIDPGTPDAFLNMMEIRDYMNSIGANLIAPCSHNLKCPMRGTSEWCHFLCRVQRSKLHKILKGGESPFEDEKFTFIAFSKNDYKKANYRVVERPFFKPKVVFLDLCSKDGIKKYTITKKNQVYKQARDLKKGDEIDIL